MNYREDDLLVMKYLQVFVYLYSIYYCSSLSVHMSRTGELKPQHKGPEVNKNYLYTFFKHVGVILLH